MSSCKRGQTAAEYVMSYSWAILALLVIGVVIVGMSWNEVSYPPMQTRGMPHFKILLQTVEAKALGEFQAGYENVNGKDITIHEVWVENLNQKINCTTSLPDKTYVSAGREFVITGEGCTQAGTSQGDEYIIVVGINYTMNVGTVSRTRSETGEVRGRYS